MGCGAADDVETCAIYATDCVGGCTGTALQKMAAFFSCFEAGWFEGFCSGGDSKAAQCLQSGGIDQDKYSKCKSDSALIKQLHAKFNEVGKGIHEFPTCHLDGKDVSDAQSPTRLRKALCGAGVQAACGPGPAPSPPVPPQPTPSPPVPPQPTPSPPVPPQPTPSPPAPPQPTPSCRTPDVTDKCWEAMGASCKETGGTSCVLCLANPVTVAKTSAAGCPQNPPGKVARCFCSQHVMETIV